MNILCSVLRMRILTIFILLVSACFYIYPQGKFEINPALSHPLNYNPKLKQESYYDNPLFRSAVPETLHVYAIRVQFKTDNNNQTTGNGRFDLSNNYPDSVDAPPHDSLYFTYKLEFLKNYYFKASKGNLIINYTLLPTVRNLANEMEVYSPRRNESLIRMGNFFYDTWRSADSAIDFSGIDASNSAFIIFHAGVGRDVDLSGFFQGELDLPSIFMGISTLKSLYGDTTRGYHTSEGLIIPGSCILPEQEWRIVNSSFGDVFLELGLNGIVVGTIGSYLGLPDLFDTRTGRTAIGRFGLMDGQGIFSYLGVFPPEPSAWEKQYLGWVTPILISSNGTYTTKAASIDFNGNESVYKVLISAKEYFLIENRNRDALGNGQTVYFVRNGVRDSIKFTKDTDAFNSADISALRGSIVDVDELDWSVPGLKNDTANYQGGILIWHVDENVIDANIASNTINVDIKHRGVDVEEAKGSQDIGVVVSTPLGDIISDGFFVDFWYNGSHYRPANIYRNEFTPTSIPNSKSYSNINSRVCITNFSQIGSSMTFNYQLCGNITNINTFPKYVGIDNSGYAQPIGIDYNLDGFDEIFININKNVFGFRNNGSNLDTASNGLLSQFNSSYILGFYTNLNSSNPSNPPQNIVVTQDSMIGFIRLNLTDTSYSIGGSIFFGQQQYNTTPSVIYDSNKVVTGGLRPSQGSLHTVYLRPGPFFGQKVDSVSEIAPILLAKSIDTLNNFLPSSFKYFALCKLSLGSTVDTVKITDNDILLNGTIISSNLGIDNVSLPALGDINRDGNQEIIFTADNKLFAINRHGVLIDNFPFSIVGVNEFTSGCSVADLNGDGIFEVIFGTGDGRIYAYGTDGKVLEGFPLLAGGLIGATPAIINAGGNFGILVYSHDGYLYGYKTPWAYDSTKIIWRNFLRDKYHSNSNFDVFSPVITGPCLPSDKVYNWPNPAYGKSTNIRYFLNGDVTSVNIKIMDLSGELVTTLAGTTNKGFDNEVPWDISTVQSGIYIAVVELEGGCSETASIKIAVVK
jgi:hypothetical protein